MSRLILGMHPWSWGGLPVSRVVSCSEPRAAAVVAAQLELEAAQVRGREQQYLREEVLIAGRLVVGRRDRQREPALGMDMLGRDRAEPQIATGAGALRRAERGEQRVERSGDRGVHELDQQYGGVGDPVAPA